MKEKWRKNSQLYKVRTKNLCVYHDSEWFVYTKTAQAA